MCFNNPNSVVKYAVSCAVHKIIMLLSCRCNSVDGKRKTASVSLTCESEMRLAHATLDAGSGDDDEDQVCCASLDHV